jgi:tetratricopeptide (TPR) repeat protein
MANRHLALFAVLAICMHLAAGCTVRRDTSSLEVLEELEVAASAQDPEQRVTDLEAFVERYAAHRFRIQAYQKILETINEDIGDAERADRYLAEILDRESDPAVRGVLLYRKFGNLFKNDKAAAAQCAANLLASDERYYRIYLYIGYYCYGAEGMEELTEKAFLKAAELAGNDVERGQAYAVLGSFLEMKGARERAIPYLTRAGNNAYATETLGKIYWEDGRKAEAIDSYISYVAAIPAARESVKLDSLYALVYPDDDGLDDKIVERRIIDEGPLPEARFADLGGGTRNLSDYKGKKLVVNVWSPT